MTRITPRTFVQAPQLYPVTAFYIVAVLVMSAVTEGWVSLSAGIVVLGLAAVLDVLIQMHRALAAVRDVVQGQLVDRIDQALEPLKNLSESRTEQPVPPPHPEGPA